MGISVIAHGLSSGGAASITTPAADTTGADLIVVAVHRYTSSATVTITDSYSNTWTPLTLQVGSLLSRLLYCARPAVGTGHTFSLSSDQSCWGLLGYLAVSGSAASPFESESGSNGFGASFQPGSVTPAEDGALVVTGCASSSLPTSIDSGFTLADSAAYSDGTHCAGGLAYLVQGTAAAVNPTWTLSAAVPYAATIAVFAPGGGGGGGGSPNLPAIAQYYRRMRAG